MFKPVIAATAVLAIAGSSVVYAQQGFGEHNGFGNGDRRAEHRHRPSAADMNAFTDARIAALKAGLELTPDQQKNWPAFEQALRGLAQLREQRIEARQARQQQDETAQQGENQNGPFDRLARRADNLTKTSAALKKVAEAGGPFYQSLTDAQKRRFRTLSRILRPHSRARFAFNERGRGWGHGGRGMGPGGMGQGGEHHRSNPDGDNRDGGGSEL